MVANARSPKLSAERPSNRTSPIATESSPEKRWFGRTPDAYPVVLPETSAEKRSTSARTTRGASIWYLTLQLRGDRRAMRGGNRKRAKRACGRPLEPLVRRHKLRQLGRLLERYRSRFAILSDVDNEQSCAVGLAHVACHVMDRARGFPPTLPNLVGLQWTCVKLILNCTFNDVCQHRNVVAMD